MACETDRQDDTPGITTSEAVEAPADGSVNVKGISLDQFWAMLDPIDA